MPAIISEFYRISDKRKPDNKSGFSILKIHLRVWVFDSYFYKILWMEGIYNCMTNKVNREAEQGMNNLQDKT